MSQNGAGVLYLGNGIPTACGHGIRPVDTYDDWFAAIFMAETGVPLKALEEWMIRLETKLDAGAAMQGSFRERVVGDLSVIRTGYDARFEAHDKAIGEVKTTLDGAEGVVNTVRMLKDESARQRSRMKYLGVVVAGVAVTVIGAGLLTLFSHLHWI